MLFATGETTKGKLNCIGMSKDAHKQGITVRELNERLTETPYYLYGWQTGSKASKRGRDGEERRRLITIHEIIAVEDVILIAQAVVFSPDAGEARHAIVWDGWRRMLFIGAGQADDRGLDGVLLVDREDQVSRLHSRAPPAVQTVPTQSHRSPKIKAERDCFSMCVRS